MLDETYELFGEGFSAIVTAPFGFRRGMRCFQGNELVVEESSEGIPEDVLNGCYDEASASISALANKKRPRPSIADGFLRGIVFAIGTSGNTNERLIVRNLE